jgi:DNA-binding transcriptional MerR regulator
MNEGLSIGKVAALAGVTPDTIRYYERVGLLTRAARTQAGYRQYTGHVVRRLEVIRNAQKFGFSLAEIAAFLRVRESGGRPCGEVRAAAQRMLNAIDRQIAELVAARRSMKHTLRDWDRKLMDTPPNQPARLLETLPASVREKRRHRLPRLG